MPTTIAKDICANEHAITFYERVSAEIMKGILRVSKMGKVGLVSITGETVCPCIYDAIETIGSNFKVRLGRYWGIMDMSGNLLCPCNYINPLHVDEGGIYCEMDEDVYYIRFKQ